MFRVFGKQQPCAAALISLTVELFGVTASNVDR